MIKKGFLKPAISIDGIGKLRFWLGLASGLITAVVLSLNFNYWREMLRFQTFSNDLLLLTAEEFQFYNYFFSALSITLGGAIAVWIWTSGKQLGRLNRRLYQRLSHTNLLLVFWVMLGVVSRFGSILPWVVYNQPGYDDHLNLADDLWLLFYLFPLVIFLQTWFVVKLYYRCAKWMVYSFGICFLSTLFISWTTAIDQSLLNQAYESVYIEEYNYVDTELRRAKEQYQLEFDPQVKALAKKWKAESACQQVASLQESFAREKKVSLDTIILEKIAIHNLKTADPEYTYKDSRKNWYYAFPYDLYRQIQLQKVPSPEATELFEVLKEEILLFNAPELEWHQYDQYSNYDLRKSRFKTMINHNLPDSVYQELKIVVDSLKADSTYSRYHSSLPQIEELGTSQAK